MVTGTVFSHILNSPSGLGVEGFFPPCLKRNFPSKVKHPHDLSSVLGGEVPGSKSRDMYKWWINCKEGYQRKDTWSQTSVDSGLRRPEHEFRSRSWLDVSMDRPRPTSSPVPTGHSLSFYPCDSYLEKVLSLSQPVSVRGDLSSSSDRVPLLPLTLGLTT